MNAVIFAGIILTDIDPITVNDRGRKRRIIKNDVRAALVRGKCAALYGRAHILAHVVVIQVYSMPRMAHCTVAHGKVAAGLQKNSLPVAVFWGGGVAHEGDAVADNTFGNKHTGNRERTEIPRLASSNCLDHNARFNSQSIAKGNCHTSGHDIRAVCLKPSSIAGKSAADGHGCIHCGRLKGIMAAIKIQGIGIYGENSIANLELELTVC
ncbi:MAG: hypothetical protein A2496_06755 [Burkholderiales bacterium RIFOXYC12_FULL_60_6]|nr:MAG: hypothetical protein A2496_06755 [Burkholderiales bacterium RIFOXYC12_FULL_60_6]